MLISYPHPTYHQHFLTCLSPCPIGQPCFQSLFETSDSKNLFVSFASGKSLQIFFCCTNSVLVDLFLEYKRSGMLYQQHVHTILSPTVLELLESKPVQLNLPLIHRQSLTKAFVDKQEPQNLQAMLECWHIMKEHHLLSGYESLKNLKLVLRKNNRR